MKETPPYSLAEIRLLIAQALDDALSAEDMVQLDTLMEQFPQYREEFLKLQAARGLVQHALERQRETELHYTKISDGVWKDIAAKLKADQATEPVGTDAEFISAYYDGEMALTDAQVQAFESQLYSNAEANRLLADIGQVSEAVRQFGYRLENTCTLDIADQVMNAYRAEQGLVAQAAATASGVPEAALDSLDRACSAEVELMSAYADQQLSARETIEANRLIESSDSARATLSRFTRLSEHIHHFSSQMQSQAPDLWPAVAEILRRPPEEGGLVISMDRYRKFKSALRLAIPTAAAAVCLLFFMPGFRLHGANGISHQAMASAMRVSVPNATSNGSSQPTDTSELASLPGTTLGQSMAPDDLELNSSDPGPDSAGLVPVVEKRMAPAPSQPLRPMLDSSSQIAAKPSRGIADTASDSPSGLKNRGKAPTSEEYLFNALNEQMPDEDISTILGK